jgi:hypothetical protein
MSLAAVLRALAQGFEAAAQLAAEDESAAPAKPAKSPAKKAAAATESAPPVAAPAAATATAPAAAPAAAAPAAPTISKEKLNAAVLAVAGKSREAAVEILGKFGVANTATLPQEKYQAVFDAFEEKKAQMDAASVQQPASLV